MFEWRVACFADVCDRYQKGVFVRIDVSHFRVWGIFRFQKQPFVFRFFFHEGEKHSHFSQEHVNGAFQLVTKDWAGWARGNLKLNAESLD